MKNNRGLALVLLLLLAVGLMFSVSLPVWALQSPYVPLAQTGAATLALKEEPSQNADIKTIMERYKQGAEFEKIAAMPAEQRRKLMDYYTKGKQAGVKDRLLATGMGSIVMGYSDIEAVRTFVQEYQKTGKMGKYLPLPHLSFTNAAEKFPEAMVMFANELETTKKMEAQIKVIIEKVGADADRKIASRNTSALAKARQNNPRIADLESRRHQAFATYQKLSKANQEPKRQQASLMTCSETNSELAAIWQSLYDKTQTPEYKEEGANRKQTAENCKEIAESNKRIELLNEILKQLEKSSSKRTSK